MTQTMSTPSQELLEKIEDIVIPAKIENEIQHELACKTLVNVVSLKKEVIATFKPIKQAQDAAKKVTLDQEKRHLLPLEEADEKLRLIISNWRDQKDKESSNFHQQLACGSGDLDFAAPAGTQSGVVSVKSLTFRIIDENKIDREFMSPDPIKIRAAIQKLGVVAEGIVGGIEVIEESRVRVRTS